MSGSLGVLPGNRRVEPALSRSWATSSSGPYVADRSAARSTATRSKLPRARTAARSRRGTVILVVTVRWATTSRTVQAAHSDGVVHPSSGRLVTRSATRCRAAATAASTPARDRAGGVLMRSRLRPPRELVGQEAAGWTSSPRYQARRRSNPSSRPTSGRQRSEEHTSELQSRQYFVCRLLLEKKK